MKKLLAVFFAVVMCLSLVACGEEAPDKQPAIDAFNRASTAFDEVANMINANPDAYAEEVITTLNEMADVMLQHKALLESDDAISEEKLNEMMAWYETVHEWVEEVKAELSEE